MQRTIYFASRCTTLSYLRGFPKPSEPPIASPIETAIKNENNPTYPNRARSASRGRLLVQRKRAQ